MEVVSFRNYRGIDVGNGENDARERWRSTGTICTAVVSSSIVVVEEQNRVSRNRVNKDLRIVVDIHPRASPAENTDRTRGAPRVVAVFPPPQSLFTLSVYPLVCNRVSPPAVIFNPIL